LREGSVTRDFENRFARAVGARFAVAVNSGTAALFLAYRAFLKPGDEVIVPDFTFAATASMLVAVGAKPIFADVDPRTFTLSPPEVEKRITRRTKALAPVHLFGQPADISALGRIARKHHLHVIWDAAQAHGARFCGRDVGSFPDVVCYSFYPTKNMTTGEGGMLTTSIARLAAEFRLLRSHGESKRYYHTSLGFNFRMTDVAAAIGRVQLSKLTAGLKVRRKNARILSSGLAGLRGITTPPLGSESVHSFCLYTISIDSEVLGISREQFRQQLLRHGIETAVHYPIPLHHQPIFAGSGQDSNFPVSTQLARSVVSLPVHPELNSSDLGRIIRAVRRVAGQANHV
jgi:dTDP-4-amino-4,6-dideoxygalactose transaminase